MAGVRETTKRSKQTNLPVLVLILLGPAGGFAEMISAIKAQAVVDRQSNSRTVVTIASTDTFPVSIKVISTPV